MAGRLPLHQQPWNGDEKPIPVCNRNSSRKWKGSSASRSTGRCIDLTSIPSERWEGWGSVGTQCEPDQAQMSPTPPTPSSGSIVAMAINHHADDSHMWRQCRISNFTSSFTSNVWLRCQSMNTWTSTACTSQWCLQKWHLHFIKEFIFSLALMFGEK